MSRRKSVISLSFEVIAFLSNAHTRGDIDSYMEQPAPAEARPKRDQRLPGRYADVGEPGAACGHTHTRPAVAALMRPAVGITQAAVPSRSASSSSTTHASAVATASAADGGGGNSSSSDSEVEVEDDEQFAAMDEEMASRRKALARASTLLSDSDSEEEEEEEVEPEQNPTAPGEKEKGKRKGPEAASSAEVGGSDQPQAVRPPPKDPLQASVEGRGESPTRTGR